jgi:hypothetical protein
MQNVFIGSGGNDPLLSAPHYPSPDEYERKLAALQELRQQVEEQRKLATAQPLTPQPASSTPVWDEIDRLTREMSETEFASVQADEDFQASQQAVLSLIQQEHLRRMRPIVEGTQEGRDALRSHLDLLRRLHKRVSKEADQERAAFRDYTEHYSDIPYTEYLKMKTGKGKPTNKQKS